MQADNLADEQLSPRSCNDGLGFVSHIWDGIPNLSVLTDSALCDHPAADFHGERSPTYSAAAIAEIVEVAMRLSVLSDLTRRYAEGGTQFGKRREIVPRIPILNDLPNLLECTSSALEPPTVEIESKSYYYGDIDFTGAPEWFRRLSDNTSEHGIPAFTTSLLAQGLLNSAAADIRALEPIFGNFHIWKQSPRRETCRALIRSLRSNEFDAEDFLSWLCRERDQLKAEPDIEPYIAEILLGIQNPGEKVVMLGDGAFVSHRQQIAVLELPENAIYRRIRGVARSRKKRERAPVTASVFDGYFENESTNSLEDAVHKRQIKNLLKEIGRSAGLDKKQTDFFVKLETGTATKRDNQTLYQAIWRRGDKIAAAKLKVFNDLTATSSSSAKGKMPQGYIQSVYREDLPNFPAGLYVLKIAEDLEYLEGADEVSEPFEAPSVCLRQWDDRDAFSIGRFNPDRIPSPKFRTLEEFQGRAAAVTPGLSVT